MTTWVTSLRRRRDPDPGNTNESGAALIEAAIVLPLILVLIFGLVAFARAYNARVTLTHAARESVRVFALTQDDVAAEAAAKNAATSLDPTQINYTSSGPCTPGDETQVVLTYPFVIEIPILGDRNITLTEAGVMRCSG